jgi:hypothetical protein
MLESHVANQEIGIGSITTQASLNEYCIGYAGDISLAVR